MTLPFCVASLECAGRQCKAGTSTLGGALIQRHIQHDGVQHDLASPLPAAGGGGLACEVPQTRNACKQTAVAQGLTWDGTRNWGNRDPGCLKSVDGHVNWNKNITGTAGGQSAVLEVPLCINAPTPAAPQGPDQFNEQTIFILADSVEGSYCRQNYDNLGDPARVCYKIHVGNEIRAQCVPGFRASFVCDETAGWTHNPWQYIGRYEKTVGDKQYYTDGSASWLIHDTEKEWVSGVNADPELASGMNDYEYFYYCPTSYKFPSTLKINSGTDASIQVEEPEFCSFEFEVSVAPTTPAGA